VKSQPIPALHIVAVRYRGSTYAEDDERCLDAFSRSGVYQTLDVPYEVVEPRFPEMLRSNNPALNLGYLGGAIADAVAAGRRKGKAVLLTGGNCTHATGVLGGLQDTHSAAARIGLVWLDAHGDFNTPNTTISGMLGGMPVAVCAGLALPQWRENSHIQSPLPTDRIILVDVRNLDPEEERLIRATDVVIAAPAPEFPGTSLQEAVDDLAARVDMLYLHIDQDILDARYVPNHGTVEPNGPGMEQVLAVIETVMATGKVVAFALVSVYGKGEGADSSIQSGIDLLRGGLVAWKQYGLPQINDKG
jgi:arginase